MIVIVAPSPLGHIVFLETLNLLFFKKKSINFISNPEKYSQKSLFVNVIN